MTESSEPDAADIADETTPAKTSRWGRLNRTNRVAALILGGIASFILAVLIFSAGVLTGAEFGGVEGHHHADEHSENADSHGDNDRQ